MRQKNRRLRRIAGLVCLLAAAAAGCNVIMDAFRGERRLSSFPHKVHMENDMECLDCHGEAGRDGLPGFPARNDCEDCHDSESDRVLLDRFFTPGGPKWAHAGRQKEEIIFDHARHVSAAGESGCRNCHGDVADSAALFGSMKVSMETCQSCHEAEHQPAEACAACHREIRKDRRPASHGGDWTYVHGTRVTDMQGGGEASCNRCHEENACMECHQNEKPRSHNEFWRRRGHGLQAGIDRDRCVVCHTRDTCDRCHEETRPVTHSAAFGSPLNRHCLSCHLPLSPAERCGVCHRDASGHDLAPALPDTEIHDQASPADCRACHTSMSHPDNGQNCRFCHF